MRVGEMKHKILIQKYERIPDGMGGSLLELGKAISLRCKKSSLSSRESFQKNREEGEHIIEFRFRVCECPVVTLDMRIIFKNENFDIISADPVDNDRTWLVRGKKVD